MPRYFFHIHDGGERLEDHCGADLPDLAAARREARSMARCLLGDLKDIGDSVDGQTIEICDEQGTSLAEVSLKDGFLA
jgi:hypothetical protein